MIWDFQYINIGSITINFIHLCVKVFVYLDRLTMLSDYSDFDKLISIVLLF